MSNIRQVPDHQEVFVDPARDESIIFELLDLKGEVEDAGSALWFLRDLANEQDAGDNMVKTVNKPLYMQCSLVKLGHSNCYCAFGDTLYQQLIQR